MLFIAPLIVHAQNYADLDINNVRARFLSNGSLTEFEAPNGSGSYVSSSANLWMGGRDANNSLHLAAVRFNQVGEDWWPGPLSNDGSASITPAVSAQYDNVWNVHTAEVVEYQAYCNCLQDPNCDVSIQFPGYQMPGYFNTWPAMGDQQAAQDPYLAPFIDFNADGIYDPADCDVPCSPGDQSLYFIYNDKLDVHTESGGLQMGVEVQARPFAFNGPSAALANTIFVEYRIINRGKLTLTDFHAGLFIDFDLGFLGDNHSGCDAAKDLWYGYSDDPVSAIAFGATILCGLINDYDGTDWTPDSALVAFNGYGSGDGILDNERQGMMHFVTHNNDGTVTGDPALAIHYYGYMKGFWKDNSQWLYGGRGHFSDTLADPDTPTRYLFPDATDPMGFGTGGVPQAPWSQVSVGLDPSDIRGVGSMGPVTLEPGAIHRIMVAFVYADAGSGGPLASVQALQARVDSIRAFAYSHDYCYSFGTELPCPEALVGIHDPMDMDGGTITLRPVPTSGILNIRLSASLQRASLRVVDGIGRTVMIEGKSNSDSRSLDVSHLANGHYTLIADLDGLRGHARFTKE